MVEFHLLDILVIPGNPDCMRNGSIRTNCHDYIIMTVYWLVHIDTTGTKGYGVNISTHRAIGADITQVFLFTFV